MDKPQKETEELEKLEQAARETSQRQSTDPGIIKQRAAKAVARRVHISASDKWWLFTVTGIFLLALGVRLFVSANPDVVNRALFPRVLNILQGCLVVCAILGVARLVELFGIGRLSSPVSRFNLKRIFRLLVGVAVILITISMVFVNWYTAVVSLGLISLVLGFALQTPISSFIGWIYILVRAPYRVGDRIKIGDERGDVIDVGYLDTTLWEFRGDYLSTDHPTGRLIKFPNTNVFSSAVYNYSWPLFPYIWNEIKFQLAYESDLDFVAKTMQEVAEEEIGEYMMAKVKEYRELLARTPIDDLEVQERPVVHFRVSDNTWIEAIVRYLVEPKQAGRIKTRLIRKLLQRLNAAPDRVLFPKSNAR